MRILTLMALLATPSIQEHVPDVKDGNGLLQLCAADNQGEALLCTGYIGGVVDGFRVYPPGDNCKSVAASFYCVPESVTQGQIKDVIVDYLKNHPATRHDPSLGLIVSALKAAWPCK
jgi:hypothetical protein